MLMIRTALCAALDMAVTTKVTPMIFSSAVGTPTKIANLQQSIWNTILNQSSWPIRLKCIIKTHGRHGTMYLD